VVTAGTIIEPSLLQSKTNNYLVSFFSDGRSAGIAYADITTGDFAATEVENADALTELRRLAPAEILLAETEKEFSNQDLPTFVTKLNPKLFSLENARQSLFSHFNTHTLQPFGLEKLPLATAAAGALISYLQQTQINGSEQLTRLASYDSRDFMLLNCYSN
jgi:DNA mismatch repair protein MutS